jgi:hypothetical protein
MTAFSIIELDTTGPVVNFGETFIDNNFNLQVPFTINETAVTISAILETDIGDFIGVINGNFIVFDIPPVESPIQGNLFVTAKDEVFNVKISSTAVTLWVTDEFDSVLEIYFFQSPILDVDIFEYPELNTNIIPDIDIEIEMM